MVIKVSMGFPEFGVSRVSMVLGLGDSRGITLESRRP
jgi:hypothetical protein